MVLRPVNKKNPEIYRLCKDVIEEAKKVTKLGGGKISFVTFSEKKLSSDEPDEFQDRMKTLLKL